MATSCAQQAVAADGHPHDLEFKIPIAASSWVALRQFPQLHTNPVDVIVAGKPIRASADSARWCEETIHLLWKNRHEFIREAERDAARQEYDRAIEQYRRDRGPGELTGQRRASGCSGLIG